MVIVEGKRRKVRIGTKMSVGTLKQAEHECKSSRDSEALKEKSTLAIDTNDKAGSHALHHMPAHAT